MPDIGKKQVDELLVLAVQKGASDVHLSPGYYPTVRIDGLLVPLTDQKVITAQGAQQMAVSLLNPEQKEHFEKTHEIDFGYQLTEDVRFRVNEYVARDNISLVFRYIPSTVKSIDELLLPPQIKLFSKLSQGFVLVAGPNGHGKSTTMASIIDLINKERAEKIITIEDPVEYIFTPERSIIDQREVGSDTFSFANALRASFRENVNVIMVGELRDLDTISAAVTAAETGHLVFGSIHTNNAPQTIERIIDSFPPNQQHQIVNQLANTLSGVISQRLIPGTRGGVVPAIELMIANTAVRNIIRENKIEQLSLAISTAADAGMISMNQSLAGLIQKQLISREQAEFFSPNIQELEALLR
ncbi:MAG: type IV pili twitching motility protein PilT [Candidatus Yanofskybacteria bacterium RIFCSPLOWO2_01_FULL_49_25]|uniref:Type IV pili twitching motility protein PilT n=1 Tax=Candidatus Yanofskybacteria bacterium RIFCSPLOWO2_01_FULL_49_25 TaxID=1802701 RepID=A0A1F8GWF6_9BACT|nr:MAG: type IV pili twitching motility protein PilT [Candidatus Yanofskybacteria bacterium RIFCSPLOWO2_01_FULL_49_25]